MFGNVIIWGLWAFALWAYLFRPSWGKLAIAFIMGLIVMPAVHESKWQLRDCFSENERRKSIRARRSALCFGCLISPEVWKGP